MADPKIKYDIEAVIKGEAEAEELAKALRGVGDVLEGGLQKGARDAALALDALGSKQRALENFGALRRETEQLNTALGAATSTVDRLGAELPQAAAGTRAFADAERSAASALQQAQGDLTRKREALKAVRDETTGAARGTTEYKATVNGLKDGIKAATTEVRAQQTALRASGQATAQAQNAEAALRKEYELAIGSAAKLSGELRSKNTALVNTRDTMKSLGLGTENLAQSERSLKTAVAQVRQEVATMAPAYQQAAAASSQATRAQAQDQRTLRDGMDSIASQLQKIQRIATIALGGSYVGGLIKDIAATADEFKNLEARIKLVTGEGDLFQAAFDGVAQVALRTNSALDETGTLFARMAKTGQEAGLSAQAAQQQALQLTETINQSVQLSGSSAESSKAAVIQLIQGLQSGVLRGEEFNSVMEQAPRLAQAMANGLGVTTGELRKMANQGALTSEVVMGALRGQADAVATEFDKLPPTVGRALQNLSSQWTLYVGASDKGLISSANAAKVIDTLAQNLDTLVSSLTTAGKLWAAIKIAGLAADFGNWAAKTLTATVAIEANTVATGANTIAQRANAGAVAANAAAQAASTVATTASTAAKKSSASAWASIADFVGRATTATKAAKVATVASTGATVAKTASIGLLRGALRGLVSLVGGPVGVIATLAMFSSEIKSGAGVVADWALGFTDAGKQLKKFEKQQKEVEQTARDHADAVKSNAAALAQQNALYEEARNRTFELTKESKGLIAQFDKLRKDGDSTAEAIGKIGKDFDLSNVPGIKNASAVLDKLLADGKLTATEFQAAWAAALSGKDLAKFEVQARAAFTGAAREGERLGQVLDATVREAVKRTGLDFDNLSGGISKVAGSAINDTDAIIRGLDRLSAQGVDTARVLTASLGKGIDTADTQQALDRVKQQIEAMRSQLGEKITNGLLDQAKEKADALRDALDKATPGINSVAEAMKVLGITSDASLKQTAATAKDAYGALADSGIASARELGEAFKKAADAAIAANKGIAPSWVQAQAAARGYVLEVDAAGKTTVKSMKEAEAATKAVGVAAKSTADNYKLLGEHAEQASAQVRKLAEAGQMLAAADQLRQDTRNKELEDSKYMNRGNTSPVDGVPTFNSKEEAEGWLKAWKAQYQRDNPFSTKRGGQLGNYMHDLTMFEYQKELDALALRDGMKNAAPGPGRDTSSTQTPNASTSNTTVNITLEGTTRSINTDAQGAATLQELVRQLAQAKGTAMR